MKLSAETMHYFVTVGSFPPSAFAESLIPSLLAKAKEISGVESKSITFNLGGGPLIESIRIRFQLTVPEAEGERWLTFVCTSNFDVQSNLTRFEEFVADRKNSSGWPEEASGYSDSPLAKQISKQIASGNKRVLQRLKAEANSKYVGAAATTSISGD